jgi:hypothetical protein
MYFNDCTDEAVQKTRLVFSLELQKNARCFDASQVVYTHTTRAVGTSFLEQVVVELTDLKEFGSP